VLTGEVKDLLLLDVTPLSLGLETKGGVFTKLVERNTTIPTEKKETFTTAEDNQTAVTIKVYQGESPIANSPANRLLAQFNLEGIAPAPRGAPQIEVTFDIDHNGILHVSAKDVGTGKEQTVRIEASGGISAADVERMRKEAELHAEADRKRREVIDTRNQADQMVFQVEKILKDNAGTLSEPDQAPVRSAIARVKDVMAGDDASAIRRAIEELQAASQAMAQHMQSRQTAGAGASGNGNGRRGGPSQGQGQDDVIDAEFEVKK
jgi:molecular chaperone DnaK